jgi:hypothetical protein
MCLTGFKTS